MQEDLFTKQRLTKDILVSELKRYYRRSLIPHLYVSVFCLAGDALLWTICWPITEIYVLLCLLIVTGVFMAAISDAAIALYRYFTSPRTYRIVTDELIESGIARRRLPGSRQWDTYYAFCFAFYGEFRVDNCPYSGPQLFKKEYYPYSREHCMLSDQLFKESIIGDEFYLLINGKTIINVFNTKMFQVVDE